MNLHDDSLSVHEAAVSLRAAKTHGCHLDKGVVSSVEYCLCLAQCLNLSGASCLSGIEILQEPVTFLVEASDALCCLHSLKLSRLLGLFVALELSFSLSLCSGLIGNGFGVLLPLLRGVSHESLVVSLGV